MSSLDYILIMFGIYTGAMVTVVAMSHRHHAKQIRKHAERIEAEREKMYANPYNYEFPWNKEQEK